MGNPVFERDRRKAAAPQFRRWALMKALLLISGFSFVSPTFAGGDGVSGRISTFAGEGGTYTFRFEQTEQGHELIRGCPSFNVKVQYDRVPWYSWLPFVETSHPSFEQTELAAKVLKSAQIKGLKVKFGYMGAGLIRSGESCHFHSKGLLLLEDGGLSVLAFHNPV